MLLSFQIVSRGERGAFFQNHAAMWGKVQRTCAGWCNVVVAEAEMGRSVSVRCFGRARQDEAQDGCGAVFVLIPSLIVIFV